MKTEKKIVKGNFYGLSPKCYIIADGDDIKLSTKGVPKSVNLDQGNFERCLYQNDPGSVAYHNITISKKQNEAVTRKTQKVALNNLYFKLHVDSNKVSVQPHKINGKFL